MREASFLNSPGRARRYHVLNGSAPACNVNVLATEGLLPCAAVPAVLRCRRRGCRQLWPAAEPAV